MKRFAPVVIVLSVVAASTLVDGCSCNHKKPVCGSEADAIKVPHQLKYKHSGSNGQGEIVAYVDGGCTAPCTGNSPIVNSFPINGLDPAGIGTCNPEHVRIDPGNAGKPVKCPDGSVEYSATTGTLVIKNSSGGTCAGADLVGTSFTARTNAGHVKLTIKEVVPITRGSVTKEGYRITATIPGSSPTVSDKSLCDKTRADQVRGEIGLPPNIGTYSATLGSGSPPPTPPAYWDFVIALPGPLYSNTVQPIAGTDGFFNLACSDDSLGNLTLDHITLPTDSAQTQYAALRLMTGTFCDVPRTTRGMNIVPQRGTGSGSGTTEAQWSAAGATCLEAERLREVGNFADVVFSSDLIPPGCGGSGGHQFCTSWDDYVKQIRAECAAGSDPIIVSDHCSGSAGVPGVPFESFIP